jgi:hypothetical protein
MALRTDWLPTIHSLRAWALLLVSIVLGVAGCDKGPPITQVSGKVTFQGQPVSEGVINFALESGFGVQAVLAGDGSYRLLSHHGKGIPLGSYKVTIAPPSFDPVPADMSNPPPPQPPYPNIPQRYRNFDTSGFTAEAGESDNVFDFDMKP